MLNETAIPWPKNRFRLAQGGKLYTITWPNSGIEVQSFFLHFWGRVLPKNEMAKKLRFFFFIFSMIFSIPASQYSPWVYRETIYALKLLISMIFLSYTLVLCPLHNGGGMIMVGDTRLLQCKKYCCLLVPIVVPTLPGGWGTISLGGDGFKGEGH